MGKGARARKEREAQAGQISAKQQQEQKSKRLHKVIGWLAALVVLVLLVFGVLYSTGVLQRHMTAMTVGDTEISGSEYNYYYNQMRNNFLSQNSDYLTQLGLTYSTIDEAMYTDTQTFGEMFREQAETTLRDTYALYNEATSQGYEMSEEGQQSYDDSIAALESSICTVDELLANPKAEIHAFGEELKAKGETLCQCDACKLAAEILADKEFLSKKSMWIFGGDGWAYDIGFGGLDHVLASGNDVNVFVFDTEVYSNTGGQASKASNIGQVAQFAAAGKEIKKKSLAEIAMSYGYIYVAQVAMGANPAQTLKAIQEAEAYPGPSLIIGYAPCEMHSIKGGMMNCQKEMKKAVECGYWNLFRFNPAAEGAKFTLDSKEPAGGYQEFLMNEARYSRLTREFPDRAGELFQRNEKAAMDRYQHLLKLKAMYSE